MTEPKWDLGRLNAEVQKARGLMAKVKIAPSAIFEEYVKGVQGILGSRPKIQQAISAWAQVTNQVTTGSNAIAEVRNPVQYYWEGGAATAFIGWLTDVQTRNMTEWKTTTSTKIIEALNKGSTAVVTFINGFATALLNLITGLQDAVLSIGEGIVGADWGKAFAAGSKALNAFNTTVTGLMETATTALSSFEEVGNNIIAATASLGKIVEPGTGLSNMGIGDPIPGSRR